eukprot:507988_1
MRETPTLLSHIRVHLNNTESLSEWLQRYESFGMDENNSNHSNKRNMKNGLLLTTTILLCILLTSLELYHDNWFTVTEQLTTKFSMINDEFSSSSERLIASDTFFDHIDDYGLKLMQLNISNSTNSIFIHHQIEGYRLHYEYHLLEHTLCHDEGGGLGNILNKYWGGRAIAYFLNYDFKWNTCKKLPHDKQKFFFSFLPKQQQNYNKSMSNYLMLFADRNKYHTQYIHPSSLLFLYYNKYYPHIIKNDYENAFQQYYESNNKSHELKHMFTSDNDIVIHIRCGDLLYYMSLDIDDNPLPHYGFLTANYLKYSVTNGITTAFDIDWIKNKISENTTIFIVSQLTKGSLRNHENIYAKQCNYLVKSLINNSFALFFQPAKIKIMYDTDINNDFYL